MQMGTLYECYAPRASDSPGALLGLRALATTRRGILRNQLTQRALVQLRAGRLAVVVHETGGAVVRLRECAPVARWVPQARGRRRAPYLLRIERLSARRAVRGQCIHNRVHQLGVGIAS